MKYFNSLIFFLLLSATIFAQSKTKITSATLGMMEARQIGPAVMGGRITAIEGVNRNPRILYVGTAGGGVWKTTTGGTKFNPVFDKHIQSIGALAIDQNHPDTIWVGTGESNMRNSVSVGNGLYRSTDAGENWEKVGLDSSEHISKIVINPKNSNIVYVAVPGHLWNDNKDRGLYKTIDGGKTWSQILYVNAKTGCGDVVVDPSNPEIIYASMWEFRRTPYSFSSGGKSSALYKSIDGGKNWEKLTNGLPKTEYGRIALAIAPSEPNNLFAIVESDNTGLYLSNDAGKNWTQQSATSNVAARPFYFSLIAVDPNNAKRVYRPAYSFSISSDGGKSFTESSYESGYVHSDMHGLWINPNNTSQMYLGTDGGVYTSLDKGNNWNYLNNIPVSQFYHVATDNEQPYNVYGGLQDNGSWMAPSQCIGGIKNGDWKGLHGGDGFWVQPDLTEKNVIYAEAQGGHMNRVNYKTNEYQNIQPQPLIGEEKLRFNWNTPIIPSPTNPKTFYTGAQYLFRTNNQGKTWERISGDLTTNDKSKQHQEESGGVSNDVTSAENHCTIYSIAESPLDKNLIWVGADDGNLQVTSDGGKTWIKVNQNITGFPLGTWVSSIEPSRFDKNTVYASFDRHAYGDIKTYIYKSTDLGKTWKSLATGDLAGYAHKIKEDIISPKLLFVGTEFGLFVSIDGGENWAQMKAKIPSVAVRDIVIQASTNDLVLGTHGRGILIVDDISALRQLTPEVLEAECTILPSRPTFLTQGHYGYAYGNAGEFVGANSTEDAIITYYLKERATTGELRLEILDKEGKVISEIEGTKRKGLNKVSWEMRSKPPRVAKGSKIDGGGFTGPMVTQGTYTVRLIKGDKHFTGKLELIPDPASPHNAEDVVLQQTTVKKLYKMEEDLAFLGEQVNNLRDSLKTGINLSKDEKIKKISQAYLNKLENFRKTLFTTKEGNVMFVDDEQLREKLSALYASVASYDGRPTDTQLERVKGLEYDLQQAQKIGQNLFTKELNELNTKLVGRTKYQLLSLEEFDKKK